MKTKKAMLILICAVVVGISAMTVSAEERQNEADQNLQDDAQATQEPILIAPGPDSTETGSETPLVIAPSPSGNEPVVSSSVAEKNDLVETAGIPILGMTCIIGVVTILIVVIYRKK